MTARGFGTGAGRRKGQTNKRSREFRERLDELSTKYGFDLIESLVVTAKGDVETVVEYARSRLEEGVEPDLRALEAVADRAVSHAMRARELLVKYGYPALKAVELVDEDGSAISGFRLVVERGGKRAADSAAPQRTNGHDEQHTDPLS